MLYGLLETAGLLKDKSIRDYACKHINMCCDINEYARWDMESFGFPCVNQQMQTINSLDDCGSFGNAVAHAYFENGSGSQRQAVDMIADYISNRQERLPDTTFYRHMPGTYHENTIWADDLYMGTLFLCRYYKITGEEKYLDDAARQFINFKRYLFMKESGLMSHVYSLKYNRKTQVPWGRGNGWVVFSLSEILSIMPKQHPARSELTRFYKELCTGILRCQDDDGMWHQVLTDLTSYAETSCTAMFICGFCRGIKNGWLSGDEYTAAALKGWNAVKSTAVDFEGNIYGVCIGSLYSFSEEYYKYKLGCNINDTHGTGIVLLAGGEIAQLEEGLEKSNF